jgi:RNA polymerase I-specific transcription initiation factor RRN5
MEAGQHEDEENFSDGSEYVLDASPVRKRETKKATKDGRIEELDESAEESTTSTSRSKSHLRKYIRLKGCYNDNYRKLLNTTISEAGHVAVDDDSEILNPMLNLPPSDLGGTSWSTDEKRIIFRAVARYGRDDLPRIASALNKSEQEVQAYLDYLQRAMLQHVRTLHGGLKTATDEMPVAVQVSEECLEELDICADALSWYQFTWEAKQEYKKHGDYWLLDRELTDEIEIALDEREDDETSTREIDSDSGDSSQREDGGVSSSKSSKNATQSGIPEIANAVPAAGLLNLSNFIELSGKVFMNSKDPEWDWRTFQDAGKPDKSHSKLSRPEESPAIFRTAFDDFHRVAVNLTKRIMHTSLFLATSRLRAKDNIEKPLAADPRVERRDVLGALQILNLKENSFEHWATLPHRHNVDWYYQIDTNNKSKKREVTVEEAERYLRHKERINHSGVEQIFQPDTSGASKQWNSQDSNSRSSPEASDDSDPPQTHHLSHDEFIDPFDQYLEHLDSQASRLHEQEIWKSLDKEAPSTANLSDIVEPKIPKAVPTIEQGTSSFADWRAWTERRAEWELKEAETSGDEESDSTRDQPRLEEGATLSWISIPQTVHTRHDEIESSAESDGRGVGVVRRRKGWSAINNPGGSKRRRAPSTIDPGTTSTFDVEMPLRKRHEAHSPSEMEVVKPPLGDEPAWLQDVQPSEDDPAWNQSPSPQESLGDAIDPRFDDSE